MTLKSEDMGKLVAGPDGWIEWSGGRNPVPGQRVDVRFRDLTIVENEASEAWQAPDGWGAGSGLAENDDIIAFRPAHREAQPETDGGGEIERVSRAIAAADGVSWDGRTVTLIAAPGSHDDEPITAKYERMAKAAISALHPTPEGQTEGAVVSEAVSILEKLAEWLTRVQLEGDDTDAEKALLALNCDSVAIVSRRLAALASKGV